MTEETLFELALNTPGSEREALLDQECRGDALLRARVRALLAAHFAGGSRFPGEGEETVDVSPGSRDGVVGRGAEETGAPGDIAGTMLAEKYKLIEPIGEGGMGTVWRARQVAPVKREVAVKLIKRGMDSRAVLARFDAERQALAVMDHPNIAKVLDAGLTPDGRPFFVMELVRGTPISEFCDLGKLTPEGRLELFVPVCQAIQHAHQKGIIHRDIKPSNVLVALYDDRAVPKVIDFGVAKATGQALTDQTIHTVFGGVIGTPQYMSPEQASFNNLDVDTRTDVYSLGALLYELLTGSPPFSPEELAHKGVMEVLRVVREEEPPKPSTRLRTAATLPTLSANRGTEPGRLTSLLRSELDWVVLKALEKDRARRYETASALAAEVQRYLSGEPVQAHPPSGAYRAAKFLRRHKGPALAAGLLAAALVAGVIGTSLGMVQARRARAGEREQRLVAQDRSEEAQDRAAELAVALRDVESERERAERSLAHGRILLAEAAWKGAGTAAHATDALKAVPERFRGWEYAHLRRTYLGPYATLQGHTGPLHQVAFHPDGSTLASASADGTVRLWDAASGECRSALVGNSPDSPRSVAFSPDGRRLAVVAGAKQIQLWDPATGSLVREFPGSIGEDDHVAFSPDGTRLAYIAGGVVRVADAATGEVRLELKGGPDTVTSVAFSPDGAWLAASGRTASPEDPEWPGSDGDRLATIFPATDDAEELAALRGKGSLRVWDSRSGEERFEISLDAGVVCLAFSPAGHLLALRFTDQTMQIRDAADGKLVREFPYHGEAYVFGPTSATYSPDGAQIAAPYLDQSLVVWDVATGGRALSVPRRPGYWSFDPNPRFSPDNRHLLIEAGEDTLELCDRSTGQCVRRLKGTPNDSYLAFSPDGRRVAAGSNDGAMRLWDLGPPGQSPFKPSHPAGNVNAVAFSPDGRAVASASEDRTIRLWDAATGIRLATLQGHTERVNTVAFSPDGRRLLSGAGSSIDDDEPPNESELMEWDATTGKLLRVLKGHEEGVASVAYSPDGTLIATGSYDKTVWLWNHADGSVRQALQGHEGYLTAVAFSPDGRLLASSSWDHTVRLWDTASGRPLHVLRGHTLPVMALAFRPDGDALASAGYDGSIRLWDLPSTRGGRVMWDYKGDIGGLAWSPDARRLASASKDGKVRLWDPATGAHLVELDTSGQVTSGVAFSPDGRRLAAGTSVSISLFSNEESGLDRNLAVWESLPLAEPKEWTGHRADLSCMALSGDGKRLATVSNDLSVRVWDTATGATIREITGLEGLAGRIGLSADGSRVVVEKYDDDTVRIWDVGSGRELTGKGQAWPDGVVASEADSARSPDGRFLYRGTWRGAGTSRGAIRVISLDISPEERDYRRRVARPDPFWHRQQATDAEEQGLWRTARFHWGWVTRLEPDDAGARARLGEVESRMAE